MVTFLYIILLIILFILPFGILYYSKWINRQFKNAGLKFKLPDILNIYLIFGIYLFGPIAFTLNVFWFFLILISIIAIALATYFGYIKQEFESAKFLRIWWRFVFLVSIVIYTVVGIVAIFRMIF